MNSTTKLAPLALLFLGACATPQIVAREPGSCMETSNMSALNGAITTNNTSWNEDCAQALAAVMFSKMQTADGKPDITGQAVAVQMYLDSNRDVQRSFDRLLAENGTSFDALVQKVRTENGPVCEANGAGQFTCA